MIKLGFLIIFLLMVALTGYLIYANYLNKKLNKKKEQIGEEIIINKYQRFSRISLACTILIGSLTVFTFVYKSPVEGIIDNLADDEEYNRLVSDAKTDIVEKEIIKAKELNEIRAFKQTIESKDNLYVTTDEEILKINKTNLEIEAIINDEVCDQQGLLLYRDKLIVYKIYEEFSEINLYNRQTLELLDEININARIININLKKDSLNVMTFCKLNNKLEFSFIDEEKVIKDYLEFDEMDYIIGSINKNIVCHTKINLKNDNVKQYGLCLSDLYYSFGEKNIICTNIFSKNKYEFNKSLIFTYDIDSMRIDGCEKIAGRVYYNPVIDGGRVYVCSNLKDNDYVVYQMDYQLNHCVIKDELIREDLSSYYKLEEQFVSFKDNMIIRYDLISGNVYNVQLLNIKFNEIQLIDYHLENEMLYMIIENEGCVILKYNLKNNEVNFEEWSSNYRAFFSKADVVIINDNGDIETKKMEEIGN